MSFDHKIAIIGVLNEKTRGVANEEQIRNADNLLKSYGWITGEELHLIKVPQAYEYVFNGTEYFRKNSTHLPFLYLGSTSRSWYNDLVTKVEEINKILGNNLCFKTRIIPD